MCVCVCVCISSWCNKESLSKLKLLVKIKARHLKSQTSNNMLHSYSIKDSLDELNQRFRVIPTDEANGNVAMICKRKYV